MIALALQGVVVGVLYIGAKSLVDDFISGCIGFALKGITRLTDGEFCLYRLTASGKEGLMPRTGFAEEGIAGFLEGGRFAGASGFDGGHGYVSCSI